MATYLATWRSAFESAGAGAAGFLSRSSFVDSAARLRSPASLK